MYEEIRYRVIDLISLVCILVLAKNYRLLFPQRPFFFCSHLILSEFKTNNPRMTPGAENNTAYEKMHYQVNKKYYSVYVFPV